MDGVVLFLESDNYFIPEMSLREISNGGH